MLGPSLAAVSGVSTHLNMLLASDLSKQVALEHFRIGSEGRGGEGRLARAWRLAASPFQLAGRLLRRRPAVLHLNTSIDRKAFWRDLIHLAVARALRVPTLYQVHGGELPQAFADAGAAHAAALHWALRAARLVVVLSREEESAYRRFAPQARLQRIPNAIDVRALAQAPRSPRRDGALELVYVGRLIRAKGLFEVVQALAALRDEGRLLHLRIAGDGPDRAELLAAIARAGLEDRVRWLGPVFGDAKARLWLDADVFAFPTWHPEGLPYAVLEAMAAGCALLTCAVGAIPDLIDDGRNGLLVAPRDAQATTRALRRLHDDRALVAALGARARERALAHYDLPTLAAAFAAAYALVCSDRH